MAKLEIFTAYRTTSKPNIICFDWGELSKPTSNLGKIYFGQAKNAVEIGKTMGRDLIQNILVNQLRQNPAYIHAIGHSLGSHLMGNVARSFTASSRKQIGRVTGLDPAMPYFKNIAPNDKIRKTDAMFVDIIHTNSGDLNHGGLSFPEPLGDMDFYPNGGEHQPLCKGETVQVGLRDLMKGGNKLYLVRSAGFSAIFSNCLDAHTSQSILLY